MQFLDSQWVRGHDFLNVAYEKDPHCHHSTADQKNKTGFLLISGTIALIGIAFVHENYGINIITHDMRQHSF